MSDSDVMKTLPEPKLKEADIESKIEEKLKKEFN